MEADCQKSRGRRKQMKGQWSTWRRGFGGNTDTNWLHIQKDVPGLIALTEEHQWIWAKMPARAGILGCQHSGILQAFFVQTVPQERISKGPQGEHEEGFSEWLRQRDQQEMATLLERCSRVQMALSFWLFSTYTLASHWHSIVYHAWYIADGLESTTLLIAA